MGTPGVPLDITKEQIVQSIKKCKGIGKNICKDLSICYHTFLRQINKDPELVQLLKDVRHAKIEEQLDYHEEVLEYASSLKEQDLTNALKAAFFYLNNKGKERGYSSLPEQAKEQNKEALTHLLSLAEAMKSSSPCPSTNKEHKEDPS